ncbi:MAG: hypothetical protein BGP09_17475 [Rhizobium sp. 60-20]|nr:MAG: hypothetical protein BGP09_17475 [Rhizobium sp. 60-20]
MNIACIGSIGGMIVMRYRLILAWLRGFARAVLVGAQRHLRDFGTLLREAAAIAFTLRCRMIDRR